MAGRRRSRGLVALAVGTAGLMGFGALGWFGWLPRYRPGLKDGERYGIDVSHHQGDQLATRQGRRHRVRLHQGERGHGRE
ncbi:MAG TPA: hypothetical protein VF660_02700 [Actinomycetota bacterium]